MSEKTIAEKLRIKKGRSVLFVNPPPGFVTRFGRLPAGVKIVDKRSRPVDIIQVFIRSQKELEAKVPKLKALVHPGGMIWVTYHKGTSSVKSDINRDDIRRYAPTIGMQAVAQVAVDDDWSALRLKVVKY